MNGSAARINFAPDSRERVLVIAFCLLAALRVFIYAAAFPLFSNNDEQRHLDVVLRYSHGQVPRGLDELTPEAVEYLAIYSTSEYFQSPTDYADGRFPPPVWLQPEEKAGPLLAARADQLRQTVNFETTQPPLYYAMAGAWWNIGKLLGLENATRIYWIRFLNSLLAMAVVWLGYQLANTVFPERAVMRLGVLLLLAFMPQDSFYSIENDNLAPVCFGLALFGLAKLFLSETPDRRTCAWTGLALAATYLVKITTIPLVAAAALFVVGLGWKWVHANRPRCWQPLLILAVCAAIPIGAWMIWCEVQYGDLTGSADKMAYLTWTRKPISRWWPHPVFTPRGLWTFLHDLLASFWRGEFLWHGETLRQGFADNAYAITSVLIPIAALISARPKIGLSPAQRDMSRLAAGSFWAGVMFLAWLSVSLDFGNCYYPSSEYPYFAAGRLLTGAMIPFALVYVRGLDILFARANSPSLALLVLTLIGILATASEWTINQPAFASPYNWFHF